MPGHPLDVAPNTVPGMPKAEVTLPAAISSVPTARHFVESVLGAWDLRAVGWDATLIVSELAANAALHAGRGPFTVRVDSDHADGVRLELQDRSPAMPRQRTHSLEVTPSRGLCVVHEDDGVDDLDAILEPFGDDGPGSAEVQGPQALVAGLAA